MRIKTGYYARTIIHASSKSTLMKHKKLSAKTSVKVRSDSRLKYHTIGLYTYYTQLAGMYIGYERYMKALRSQTKINTRSSSHLSVATAMKAKTTIKTTSSARLQKRTYKHDPQMFTKSEPIFIYNKDEQLVLVLSDDTIPYTISSDNQGVIEELNGGVTLNIDVLANDSQVERIENEGRAVTRDIDGNFMEFIIREVDDIYGDGSIKSVFAEGGEYELIDTFLPSYVQANVDFETALKAVISGTRFEIGDIDKFYETKSVDLKRMSVRRAVNELINMWGGEVRYRVETSGNRITRRYIDVFKMRGNDRGKRFEDGKDILSANRTLDSRDIKTRLYGYGASDENGNRLTFANVEWRVEWGDPVDKPLGQTWVGDPESLERWGAQGGRKHRDGFYDGQEEDPAELLLNTWNNLQKTNKLRDTYEMDVVQVGELLGIPHEKVRLGDRVRAIINDMHPPLYAEASVIEFTHNLNDRKKSKCVLGHFRAKLNTSERIADIEKDYNDNRGKWEKKPDKIKNELEKEIDEELEKAYERINQAKAELTEAMDRINDTKIDLEDAEKAIQDTINNPQNYIGYFDGDVAARSITLWDRVISRDAIFTGTVQGSALTFLEGDFKRANIIDAIIQNATITGRLDGVDGTFVGTVTAENIRGLEISGVTYKTGTKQDYHIHMEEQEITWWEGNKRKARFGFRDEEGRLSQEPFIQLGEGKNDRMRTSRGFIEKKSESMNVSYLNQDESYSSLRMAWSGSVALEAKHVLNLESKETIQANNKISAPEFVKTSTVKSKDNIKKYDGDALGIVMDHDIFTFHFKRDIEAGNFDDVQIGFLAEAAPMLKTGDSISVDRAVAYNWAATQQQQKEMETLRKRVEDLETMMEAI